MKIGSALCYAEYCADFKGRLAGNRPLQNLKLLRRQLWEVRQFGVRQQAIQRRQRKRAKELRLGDDSNQLCRVFRKRHVARESKDEQRTICGMNGHVKSGGKTERSESFGDLPCT